MKMLRKLIAIASIVGWLLAVGNTAKADVIDDLLGEKLWTKRDAYDAAHLLMVPMIDAVQRGDTRRVEAFRDFFRRYVADTEREELGLLTQLQFDYLLSHFLLYLTAPKCLDADRALISHLERGVSSALTSPAWLWTKPDFADMFARAEWKLSQERTKPSYLRAFFDEEFFAFAISADLTVAMGNCLASPPPAILRAASLGQTILTAEGVMKDGLWQFQPGVWRDHRDYAFAGHQALAPDLTPLPVENIGLDSSHSSRFPLWLESFRCAAPRNGAVRADLDAIRAGMTRNFLTRIYKQPSADFPAVRLTNYMSGDNGLYRYGYATSGKGGGFEPFGLSGTFNLGWWAFLGPDLAPVYRAHLNSLPFDARVKALYLQPIVTDKAAPRPRHPKFSDVAFLDGELLKIVIQSAVNVAERRVDICPT